MNARERALKAKILKLAQSDKAKGGLPPRPTGLLRKEKSAPTIVVENNDVESSSIPDIYKWQPGKLSKATSFNMYKHRGTPMSASRISESDSVHLETQSSWVFSPNNDNDGTKIDDRYNYL